MFSFKKYTDERVLKKEVHAKEIQEQNCGVLRSFLCGSDPSVQVVASEYQRNCTILVVMQDTWDTVPVTFRVKKKELLLCIHAIMDANMLSTHCTIM